jgi:shikimate dehydrogenase
MSMPFLKLAVIGDPVAHSKSPHLHTGFLTQSNLAGSYEAIQIVAGTAREELIRLLSQGYLGLNVTTPLKEEVVAHLSAMDPLVASIGAANTLIATPYGWHGANTDGIGVCMALQVAFGHPRPLAGLRVLVLGTGPTARAAVATLRAAEAKVAVWSRSEERAAELASRFDAQAWSAESTFDAVIATLPPNPTLPVAILDVLIATPVVMDANYGPRATLENEIGRPIMDGRLMLEAQAQASFERWVQKFGEGEI